jgi:hypothetical protein
VTAVDLSQREELDAGGEGIADGAVEQAAAVAVGRRDPLPPSVPLTIAGWC